MAVNLKSISEVAIRPPKPKWWVWLFLFIASLLIGFYWAITLSKSTGQTSWDFWVISIGIPVLCWSIVLILRLAYYKGELAMAEGWDIEREKTIQSEIERGRRSLSVLNISMHTGLRELDDVLGSKQWESLQNQGYAIKTQPSWDEDAESVRHSRLMFEKGETANQVTFRVLKQTLKELNQTLSALPDNIALSILIENNSGLTDVEINNLVDQHWQEHEITQQFTRVNGSGLQKIDEWLDQSNNENSVLFVLSLEIKPEIIEGSAESVVGLILSKKELDLDIEPLAYLHRPEQTLKNKQEDFSYAMERALDWVPIAATEVSKGWLVGIVNDFHIMIASELSVISSPINIGKDLHDLSNTLGYPGGASPWVAIACAANSAGTNKESQLIISGNNDDISPIWLALVMPL